MATVLSVARGCAMQLIIRPCSREDLRELEWGDAFRHDRPLIEYVFQQTSTHEMAMLVASVEDQHVGQLWIDLARKPGIAILWGLRVKPRWRRHGIGTQLIGTGEREALRVGALEGELAVGADNQRARALYERLGYRFIGREIAVDTVTGARLGFELEVLHRPLVAGMRCDHTS